MTPTAQQVHAALLNYYRPMRTNGARVKDALDHVKNSTKEKPGDNRAQMFGDIDNTEAVRELE